MKIMTNSYRKTFRLIGLRCLGILFCEAAIIFFPLWLISFGHINFSGKFNGFADRIAEITTNEIGF